jgi:hypothetical protein
VAGRNMKVIDEYMAGEAGIDYVQYAEGKDPNEVNLKQVAKEIRAKIDVLGMDEPQIANDMKKFVFSSDTDIDKEFAKGEVPMDEI